MGETIHLKIDGGDVTVAAPASILQAAMASGRALTANVGCMGQGVCGACRCMVRRDGEREIATLLACETKAEAGMQVSFIDYFTPDKPHVYDISSIQDIWQLPDAVATYFPEAAHCRHCSGCDRACPKGLSVQQGVAQSITGDFAGAAAVFEQCVMCNLCTLACPEHIWPNHLGLMVRRAMAALTLRPADLMRRLDDVERETLRSDAPSAVLADTVSTAVQGS
jgi:succinate dehydrogenase/fumarate reductase-like Fe-S protein